MSHAPHELAEEFPEHVDIMRQLKTNDARFSRLFDEYHEVNRAIHRAETNVEPTDDFNEVEMRKTRITLKDEIWGILSTA